MSIRKAKVDKAIRVTESTRDRLQAIGMKNETYDAVINRLMDHLEEARQELEAARGQIRLMEAVKRLKEEAEAK